MKVLIATQKPFAKAAVDSIKEVIANAGFEPVMLEKYAGADDLKKAVADADAIIIRSDIIDADSACRSSKTENSGACRRRIRQRGPCHGKGNKV